MRFWHQRMMILFIHNHFFEPRTMELSGHMSASVGIAGMLSPSNASKESEEFCRRIVVGEGVICGRTMLSGSFLPGNRLWIPSVFDSIEYKAFLQCQQLRSAVFEIGSQLTRIEADGFRGSGLTDISIPSQVQKVAIGCFVGCHSIVSVRFESVSRLTRIESKRTHFMEVD
jgi:hypothetical protein